MPYVLRQLTTPSGSGRKVTPFGYPAPVAQSSLRTIPPSCATQRLGGVPAGDPTAGGPNSVTWLSACWAESMTGKSSCAMTRLNVTAPGPVALRETWTFDIAVAISAAFAGLTPSASAYPPTTSP